MLPAEPDLSTPEPVSLKKMDSTAAKNKNSKQLPPNDIIFEEDGPASQNEGQTVGKHRLNHG